MKAIIEVDVPDFQIGQEVSIYFKDTMMIRGVVQQLSGDINDVHLVEPQESEIRDDSRRNKRVC